MFKYLSGIKPTGQLHIGNFVSTIKPIVENGLQDQTLFLIADHHALTSYHPNIYSDKIDISKILYSFGIENIVYQSMFPEIFELMWILSCFTSKGLMNRSHAYKDITTKNEQEGKDIDKDVNMGLFNYPILMAADLTIFNCEYVFIGSDQLQHIEMANDVVERFNYYVNSNVLKVPEPIVKSEDNIMGYDGRKMSKSYNNTMPLMCSKKKLRKHIFSIKTNSKNEGEVKYWDESPVTTLYKCFATKKECEDLTSQMKSGIGWGKVKQVVFDKINEQLEEPREQYNNCSDSDIEYLVIENCNNLKDEVEMKVDSQVKRLLNNK